MTYEEAVEIIEDALRDYSADEFDVLDTVRAHVWQEGRESLAQDRVMRFTEDYTPNENPYLEN